MRVNEMRANQMVSVSILTHCELLLIASAIVEVVDLNIRFRPAPFPARVSFDLSLLLLVLLKTR